MMENKLTANIMVKDGAKFIEQVLLSLIGNVKEIKVADTGSSDGTHSIVEDIISKYGHMGTQINFVQCGQFMGSWKQGIHGLTDIRNKMLAETETEFAIIVDDDEILPEPLWDELYEVLETIPDEIVAITVPMLDFVHWGHINGRNIVSPCNRIVRPDKVEFRGVWPNEYWVVKGEEAWLNKYKDSRVLHLKNPYFHYGRLKKRNDITRPKDNVMEVPFFGRHPEVIEKAFEKEIKNAL